MLSLPYRDGHARNVPCELERSVQWQIDACSHRCDASGGIDVTAQPRMWEYLRLDTRARAFIRSKVRSSASGDERPSVNAL